MEIWKDVPNYKGYYQISNLGRVRGIDRYVRISNGRKRFVKGEVMKIGTNHNGYSVVKFCRDGNYKTLKVHRLVLESFIGISEDKCCCHHINSIKSDNRLENLKWVNSSENSKLAYQDGLRVRSRYRPVVDTCRGITYKSITDTAMANDISKWKLRGMLNGYVVNDTCLKYAS